MSSGQQSPRFLTIPDVAQELAISDSQVRALIKSGDLSAIQIGGRGHWRIGRTDLEEYISAAYARTIEAIRRGDFTGDQSGLSSHPGQ